MRISVQENCSFLGVEALHCRTLARSEGLPKGYSRAGSAIRILPTSLVLLLACRARGRPTKSGPRRPRPPPARSLLDCPQLPEAPRWPAARLRNTPLHTNRHQPLEAEAGLVGVHGIGRLLLGLCRRHLRYADTQAAHAERGVSGLVPEVGILTLNPN